ncbi:MAG: hypothetical protein KJ587_20350, partial [Alphaproteobacteria bacterium]|nr:hypothetical protein [Alphaproteobacteria bacterium]
MTTVTEALLAMLGRCDGARKRDNVGFNGRDAEFAHSLGEAVDEYGSLTPKQEKAMHKVLLTYKKQLKDLDIEYDSLVIEVDERIKSETKFSVVNSQYGKKIVLEFPYDAEIVEKLKALDWNNTHRRWNGSAWEIDASSNGLIGLEEVGFEIPEDIREVCGQSSKATKEIVIDEGTEVRILLHPNFSKIDRKIPKSVNDAINDKLAYQPQGYEWSPKYKSGE